MKIDTKEVTTIDIETEMSPVQYMDALNINGVVNMKTSFKYSDIEKVQVDNHSVDLFNIIVYLNHHHNITPNTIINFQKVF